MCLLCHLLHQECLCNNWNKIYLMHCFLTLFSTATKSLKKNGHLSYLLLYIFIGSAMLTCNNIINSIKSQMDIIKYTIKIKQNLYIDNTVAIALITSIYAMFCIKLVNIKYNMLKRFNFISYNHSMKHTHYSYNIGLHWMEYFDIKHQCNIWGWEWPKHHIIIKTNWQQLQR